MTIGNYSDALMRRDISKMSLGFLQDLGVTSSKINNHGQGFNSKTHAERAIKRFGLQLEKEFWSMVYEKSPCTFWDKDSAPSSQAKVT